LDHEIFDHAMEDGAFESFAGWFIGQFFEILRRYGNCVSEQTDFDPTSWFTADGDVEPNLIRAEI
jgi:hypothetical protein